MINRNLIIILCFISFVSKGQTCIADWIDVNCFKNQRIKGINLYIIKENKKVLIERNEFNVKGMLEKEFVYCDFLNDPTDEIEITSYEYDNTDTLLVHKTYGTKKGDLINIIYSNVFTYEFNSNKQLVSKGTLDTTDKDYEKENYIYNGQGLTTEKRIDFYNKSKDSIKFFFTDRYEYDKSNNLIKESFIPDSVVTFERLFTYDYSGNLTKFNTKGVHHCGDDIDRYEIKYNLKSKPILKEVWNAVGENWAFEYSYNELGLLSKEVYKTKSPLIIKNSSADQNPPPPPPYYRQEMLEKEYKNEKEVNYIYNSDRLLIKVIEKHLKYGIVDTFLIEYDRLNNR